MSIDWYEMFAFSLSPLELFVRGTAIYWFLLLAFRTFMQRDLGAVGIADVLLLVLVADAAQNGMAGDYKSIGDGLVLVSTMLGWNLLFDMLAFRFPRLRRVLEPPAFKLVRNGRTLDRNLRRERLSLEELMAKMREHGVSDLSQVREAFMESDGTITVIRRDGRDCGGSADERKRAL